MENPIVLRESIFRPSGRKSMHFSQVKKSRVGILFRLKKQVLHGQNVN